MAKGDTIIDDGSIYRVATRAIIKNDQDELLIMQNEAGHWEIPGGGLDHGETLEQGVARELLEELCVEPKTIGPVQFMYTVAYTHKNYEIMRLAMPVTLKSNDFKPSDGMTAWKYVSHDDFLNADLMGEGDVQFIAQNIWPTSRVE